MKREAIRATVQAYVDAVGATDPDAVLALYAPDATVEDPVGTDAHRGRDAIAAFYAKSAGYHNESELLDCRISGDNAAFRFRITTTLPERTVEVTPIDVMTFDEDARITSMQAFWHTSDYRVVRPR
ncbi:SgcJ/EcaC family oxidoreductase [Tomitella fengzijianii]|uniref:SgcJ/EcaC family oxidoreductase n=1 Tax=Tomitella fengzijianii TaxID=2597660 RepID=A0A516X7N6_9ACTN|nr:SgcJ/EcaC family oxidoreductase [Tomitella fengzijianii]